MDEKITAIQIEYLKSIGQDDEGIYESTHDYEDWDWKEFADWLESALQSARERIFELEADVRNMERAAYGFRDERDTIKAEAARMREAVLKYVPAMLRAGYHMAGVDCPNGESRELWQRAAHDVEDFILRPSITPPAAPEKAETCPTCHGVLAHGGIDPLTGKKCPTCKGTGKPIAEGGEG